MKKQHPKYQIKPDDTIASVTELFGVAKDIWVRYHNTMCRMDNIIRDHLPEHLSEIYLLPDLWSKARELNIRNDKSKHAHLKNNPVILRNGNVLLFTPKNLNNRYGVTTYCNNNKVQYEITITYIERGSDNHFILCIDRGQLYINDQEIDMLLYEMADKMSKVFYPLLIEMDKKGEIYSINNYSEIQERSQNIIEELKRYYIGEYAEKYIRNFQANCTNHNTIKNGIRKELFFQLFFLPIYGFYDNDLTEKREFTWYDKYNIQNKEVLNVSIHPHYNRTGKLRVHVKTEEKEPPGLSVNAEYRLYPDDHSIAIITGEITLFNKQQQPVTTRFEIAHLNEQNTNI